MILFTRWLQNSLRCIVIDSYFIAKDILENKLIQASHFIEIHCMMLHILPSGF